MHAFQHNLKQIKRLLKQWNKEEYDNTCHEKHTMEKEISTI